MADRTAHRYMSLRTDHRMGRSVALEHPTLLFRVSHLLSRTNRRRGPVRWWKWCYGWQQALARVEGKVVDVADVMDAADAGRDGCGGCGRRWMRRMREAMDAADAGGGRGDAIDGADAGTCGCGQGELDCIVVTSHSIDE